MIPIGLLESCMYPLLLVVELFDVLSSDCVVVLSQYLRHCLHIRDFELCVDRLQNSLHVSPVMDLSDHSLLRYSILKLLKQLTNGSSPHVQVVC